MEKQYYTGNERVRVESVEEENILNKFYRDCTYNPKGCGTFMKNRCSPYPVVAYMKTDTYGSGWDSGEYLNGRELSVEEFLSKYADVKSRDEGTVDTSTEVASWTQSHYDQIYKLKPHEIKSGEVRLDAYKVNKAWGLNSVDPTGAAFHCLKTLTRIPKNKNPLERELIALIGQIKGWAREEDVDLSKYLK